MTRLKLAAVAAIALTIVSALPAVAQSVITFAPNAKIPNQPSSTYQCDSDLGFLRRVHPAQVAGIDEGTRVWITELCPSFGLMRSEGNAAYLRPTIADNDVLRVALQRRAYSADDVFAVRMMGSDTVALYVHHFGR